MLGRGQRRDLLVLRSLLGVSIARFVNDRNTALQMMVLFSKRNKLDISAWISVPLVLTDVFGSFEFPFEPTFVSL
jgi:hypothetical protein